MESMMDGQRYPSQMGNLHKYSPLMFGDACLITEQNGLGNSKEAYEEEHTSRLVKAFLRVRERVINAAVNGVPENWKAKEGIRHQTEEIQPQKNQESEGNDARVATTSERKVDVDIIETDNAEENDKCSLIDYDYVGDSPEAPVQEITVNICCFIRI